MKKLLFALMVLGTMSCSKDEPKPTVNCDCGEVLTKTEYNHFSGRIYSIGAKNNCNGTYKEFNVAFSVYNETEKGDNYCTSNW